MKLTELLSVMANTKITVTLVDADDNTLVSFVNTGYSNLSTSLLEREVKRWTIVSNSSVTVVLKDESTTTDTTDTTTETTTE